MAQADSAKVPPLSSNADCTPDCRHRSFVLTSATLVTAGMLLAASYGLSKDLFVLRALALQMALAALAIWLCMSAIRFRCQTVQQRHAGPSNVSAGQTGVRSSRWGDEFGDAEDDVEPASLWDADHYRKLHYLFLAVIPTALIILLAASMLWMSQGKNAVAPSAGVTTALAMICLTGSCLWLILARVFQGIAIDELPEGHGLALVFREVQWANLLTAAALLLSWLWPAAVVWAARVLLGWVTIASLEQLGRSIVAWLRPIETAIGIPPLRLAIREALFVHGSPVHSLFDRLEARLGVSFRSSWALLFVRRSLVPALLLVVLLLWGLSSLAVVQIDELGVRESFGQAQADPLPPGLHWKLPWPFGRVLRFPVKRVSVKPIGFVSNPGRQPSFLWSKKHAQQEFALVLGDGSELVAIDCIVYYKIHEDPRRFFDYVYHCQNPQDALEAYAYRTLMEQTRCTTLREILTANRARFADRLEQALRAYAESNHLGIEVVDVALMGLHPPVEAAAAYLDVISARIDATRFQVEALGQKAVTIANAHQESATTIASAQAEAARRTGKALGESAEFLAIGQSYAVAPEPFQLRLWYEALEEILENKRFVLIDHTVAAAPGGILLDQRRAVVTSEDPVPLTRDAGLPTTGGRKRGGGGK